MILAASIGNNKYVYIVVVLAPKERTKSEYGLDVRVTGCDRSDFVLYLFDSKPSIHLSKEPLTSRL